MAGGIYPEIETPVFNAANNIIPEDFQLMMTSPEGGEIRYTLDGTDPGHFTLAASPSIMVYDNMALPLNGDTINISARVKKDTLWSCLVTKLFIVDNFSSSFITALSGRDEYLYNYPNPVQDYTHIVFSLTESSQVTIKIVNILGIEISTVVNAFMETGEHTVTWNAGNLPSGLYLCVLENKTNSTCRRITLVKD